MSVESPLLPTPMEPGRFGVVLFDLPAERCAALAADLRRLSHKPIRYCWLPSGEDEPGRVLVKVDEPPPLVVWRMLDDGIGVFGEQSPGLWVQLGFRHRLPESVQPPADGLMLLRVQAAAEHLGSVSFAGEIEELSLQPSPAVQSSGSSAATIPVRLRLIPAADDEPPRLWVLRADALAQLTAYCRSTHQQLLNRFTVAVSATSGRPCVVLRAINAKGPPPIFVGPATAYRTFLKLPNLLLPVGTKLVPPLRRDALRSAFGVDSARVVWLHPLDDGGFRPESLAESAFRSLPDWIDYRLGEPSRTLKTWTQSHGWELLPFVERPEPKRRSTPPSTQPTEKETEKKSRGWVTQTIDLLKKLRSRSVPRPTPLEVTEEPSIPVNEAVKTALNQGHRLHLARPENTSAALERSRALEARFLKHLPEMQPEGHAELWAELAAAYDAAGNYSDATLAWLNALWGKEKPSPLWAWGWVRSEAKAARPEVKSIDPIPWLASTPTAGTTRAMAAWVVWASLQNPTPSAFVQRAADLHTWLEANEQWLPIRAAWLSRIALVRAGSTDALGLARTRDRLADRLLANGLSLELDSPSFLRFAGDNVRERFQEARKWLKDKRELILDWLARLSQQSRYGPAPATGPNILRRVGIESEAANTRAYTDYVLAWGLARFAEYNSADNLRKLAANALPADEPVHGILRDAFEFRIKQIRDGKPPHGPLPAQLLSRIEALEHGRYAIDKLREHSRILEPTVRVGSYDAAIHRPPDSTTSLSDQLAEVEKLLPDSAQGGDRPQFAELVEIVLNRASELSDASAASLFRALPKALDAAHDDPRLLARLFEKSFAAAAVWDRGDVAHDLVGRFLHAADGRSGWEIAESVMGQALRSLRRLGLKKDAEIVVHVVAERLLQGQPIGRVRVARSGEWPIVLRVLLHAAAEWFFAGNSDDAYAILNEAQKDLFAAETTTANRTKLALAYTATLAHAPARIALGRLEELFQLLKRIKVEGSTNEYYALQPLVLIETAVRAIVSDEYAVGPQVRAWLDADELAVRRRIRDELKETLASQGL